MEQPPKLDEEDEHTQGDAVGPGTGGSQKNAKPAPSSGPSTKKLARTDNSGKDRAGPFASLPMQFGRYEVLKELGSGGMGAVYLANDIELDRPVALKVARSSLSGLDNILQRMTIEAKSAAKLDHPQICKVYDAGEIDDIRFIALQYIEGEDLQRYLKRNGRKQAPDEAVRIVVQILRALEAAHNQGVIHRDLKPGNVMLNKRNQPVIMDFGLARKSLESSDDGLTQGAAVGTPAYMSPEQARGDADEIDCRTDLYAVGVMLFEMLTGHLPFTGSYVDLMYRKKYQEPPSPLTADPSLDPQLAAICHKMIAKKKEDRYASCAEMIAALESIDAIYQRSEDTDVYESGLSIGAMPDDPEELVGKVIDRRYSLEKFIDRGGFGAVYQGTDRRLKTIIAIKVVPSSTEFIKDARRLAEVKHPNIVNVSDVGSYKGLAFLVMDFLRGTTLDKLFHNQERELSLNQLRQFVDEVGDALTTAHNHQLIHRDIKPQNVALILNDQTSAITTHQRRFVLFDFGIANKQDASETLNYITSNGHETPEYMAPEQLMATNESWATPYSDIYAFGVVLYQMMVGRVPFPLHDQSDSAREKCMNAVINEAPPRFASVAKDRKNQYPDELEELVLQCLEKAPDQRPSSMADVKKRFLEIFDRSCPLGLTTTSVEISTFSGSGSDVFHPRQSSTEILVQKAAWIPLVVVFAVVFAMLSIIGGWMLKPAILAVGTSASSSSTTPLTSSMKATLTETGNDGQPLTVDEHTAVQLEAGSSVVLTFAVECPPEWKVTFRIDQHQDGLVIGRKSLNPKTEQITVSADDPNIDTSKLRELRLAATTSADDKSDEEIEKRFEVKVKRPQVWLPQTNGGALKLTEADDSWLAKIDGTVFATILEGKIGGETVRFRLVPATEIVDRQVPTLYPTFYIMETLVTNALFRKFTESTDSQPFREFPREEDEERRWKQIGLESRPVTDLYILEAYQFAQWLLGNETGSLPTTNEWQIAAGYTDFKRRVLQAPFDPKDELIPKLGTKAKFGNGPDQSGIYTPDGRFTGPRSPYGCIFPQGIGDPPDDELIWPSEMTCTTVQNLGKPVIDLRDLCKNGVLSVQNAGAILLNEREVELRGSGKEEEISWIKRDDMRIKTEDELKPDANTLVIEMDDIKFARLECHDKKTAFRVLLVIKRSNSLMTLQNDRG